MSRTKCPGCGCHLVASVKLMNREWDIENNYKKNAKSQARFDHARAVELFKGGLSQAAIAQQFGVTQAAISQLLRKKGVT